MDDAPHFPITLKETARKLVQKRHKCRIIDVSKDSPVDWRCGRRKRGTWKLWTLGLFEVQPINLNTKEVREGGIRLDHVRYIDACKRSAEDQTMLHLWLWAEGGIFCTYVPAIRHTTCDQGIALSRESFKLVIPRRLLTVDYRSDHREDAGRDQRPRSAGGEEGVAGEQPVNVGLLEHASDIQDGLREVGRRRKEDPAKNLDLGL